MTSKSAFDDKLSMTIASAAPLGDGSARMTTSIAQLPPLSPAQLARAAQIAQRSFDPNASILQELAAAIRAPAPEAPPATNETSAVSAMADAVLQQCALEDGSFTMSERAFVDVGRRVHEAGDKQAWATALLALALQLSAVPGAAHAAERSAALAAIALGDVELNGMLCRKLYGRG